MTASIETLPTDARNKAGRTPAAVGVSVIIPAFNEELSIGTVVRAAQTSLSGQTLAFEIIVVDDGSRDDTAGRALAAGARVVQHPYNRGYGNSLKTGFLAARYENVIICDADESYPLDHIPVLLHDADRYHMIVGARQGHQFRGRFIKSVGRWLQLWLVRFSCGTHVPDANSGFRLIKRSLALRYVDHVCAGFSFTTSITIALLCEQYVVKFVGIPYFPRAGHSHVRYFRDTLRSIQIIVQSMLRYNPIKAFLLAGMFSLVPMVVFLMASLAWPVHLFTAMLFAAVFLLTQAMGMLAYVAGRPARYDVPLDAGLNGWLHAQEAREFRTAALRVSYDDQERS